MSNPSKTKNETLKLYQEQGLEAALVYLRAQENISIGLQAWGALARFIYNEQHDVNLMIDVFQQAITYGITAIDVITDASERVEIQSQIKGLHYDLGASTWPGWGDEGIIITPQQMAIGYQAAQDNLTWAEKLAKPHIPMGRACWLLAAHQLAKGEYSLAIENFNKAVTHARLGESEAEAYLSDGFIAVCRILAENDDAYAALDKIKNELQPLEHGLFFISQLDTALTIFKKD